MSDKAQKAIAELASQVRSSYKTLSEPEIIGRIMVISGRSFAASCKGYEIMIAGNMFDKFVSRDGYGAIARMIERNPAILDAFEILDLVPQTCEVMKFNGWERPKLYSAERVAIGLEEPRF
jgi:hypothetical protein